MDFKSLLSQLDQLNEATEKTKTGLKHTAEPGGYGRKDDEDEEGNKVKPASTEKRGKGRPKKATSTSGEDKKYDFSAFGVKAGKDVKLPKYDKKKTTKHSLKEYFDQLDKALNEEGYSTAPMPGAVAVKDATGKVVATAKNPQAAAAFEKGDITLGGDELGEGDIGKHNNATTGFDALVRKLTPKYGKEAATKIAGAQMKKIKEAEMPTHDGDMGAGLGAGRSQAAMEDSSDAASDKREALAKEIFDLGMSIHQNDRMYNQDDPEGKAQLAKLKAQFAQQFPGENPVKIGSAISDRDYQTRQQQNVAQAKQRPASIMQKAKNALGGMFEGSKKPDANKNGIPDYAEDGKGKNDLKKKKVKESMNENLLAAKLKGKHDGIKGHSHCGKNYQDMEEARCYHEGYKEGLDECYGQMPIQGLVGEAGNEIENMASYGARTPEVDEGNAFTAALARTPKGGAFKVGGTSFTDRSGYDAKIDEFAFEALDSQLNALLESDNKVSEGMTVSISKGQQGAPDSVSVSAQDGEAEQLLSIIKSAGLGLFGGEEQNGYGAPQGGNSPGGISVVDDHDGMMALMRKLSGAGEEVSGGDYENEEGHGDEQGEHDHEETCNECGEMLEAGHSCGSKEMVDEVESEDQQLYNVAEDNPPDSGADNTDADVAGQVGSDKALATADAAADEEEAKIYSSPTNEAEDETGEEAGEEEEQKEKMSESSFFSLYKKLAVLSEESTSEKDDKAEKAAKKVAKDIEYDEGHKGKDDDKAEEAGKKVKKDIEYDDKKDKKEKIDEWANEAGKNGTDASFEADIDFMMNIISGGLNKRKQTGQTTIPVLGTQMNRMVSHSTTDINESKMLNESVSDWKKLAGI